MKCWSTAPSSKSSTPPRMQMEASNLEFPTKEPIGCSSKNRWTRVVGWSNCWRLQRVVAPQHLFAEDLLGRLLLKWSKGCSKLQKLKSGGSKQWSCQGHDGFTLLTAAKSRSCAAFQDCCWVSLRSGKEIKYSTSAQKFGENTGG